jgi:hypothetical protein
MREMEHMVGLIRRLYPLKRWKFSTDILSGLEVKDHFHIHEV